MNVGQNTVSSRARQIIKKYSTEDIPRENSKHDSKEKRTGLSKPHLQVQVDFDTKSENQSRGTNRPFFKFF